MRDVFVPAVGIRIPVVGFGCGALTGTSRKDALRLLEKAFDAGVRHFDVARSYGYGEAEGILGAFVKSRRAEVTITTKFGIQPPRRTSALGLAIQVGRRVVRLLPSTRKVLQRRTQTLTKSGGFSVSDARISLETSLRELGTDSIDFYLLHDYVVSDHTADELVSFLEGAVKAGKVRSFGIGTGINNVLRALESQPKLCNVIQFENSVLKQNMRSLPSPASSRLVITHGALQSYRSVSSFLAAHIDTAKDWSKRLGVDCLQEDTISAPLQPQTTGISLAFGQTRQATAPTAVNCKGSSASVSGYTYGTTNNKLVDISPSGNICAGTWNRNSGGGIADYTICNYPSAAAIPSGLPYATASITASASSVVSNPVTVYVHAQVSSISLVGPQQCLSQGQLAQLDAQACYSSNGQQVLMCAPSTVPSTNYACPLPTGVTSVPNCTSAIGTLTYSPGTAAIASINAETNQITAEQPGTTVITASVAGSGSSAGYFSTCPPKSISITVNGNTSGTVTQGVVQNLVTTVTDTNGNPITGLTLDYQSTNPLDITAGASGAITANFPGAASIYAVCQPLTCNPAPINEVGLYGTGLPVSSNPVNITTPGTASSYVWYSSPGQSQYFVPVQLLSGTVGSTVRLPYVPNSMVMDHTGTSLYFGSSHELMVFSTATNSLTTQNPNAPGVVLAVSPNNSGAHQ